MRAVAARMHHALGDALMVEMEDLFAEMEILEHGRATRADLQRILIIGDRPALRGGQHRSGSAGMLVQFASFASNQFLVMDDGLAAGISAWRLGHGLFSSCGFLGLLFSATMSARR